MSENRWSDPYRAWTPFDLWSDVLVDGLLRADTMLDEARRRGTLAMDQTDAAMTEVTRLGSGSLGVARQVADDWFRAVRASTDFIGAMVGSTRGRVGAPRDTKAHE